MKNDNGVTLIELLVIVSIIGILAVALSFSFKGWMGNYRIESQTKGLYSDLMDARTRAMTRGRMHFVTLTATQYTIQEDISPWPNGDGVLNAADNVRPVGYNDPIPLLQKTLGYNYQLATITLAIPGTFNIDTRGLISAQGAFRINNTLNPDYDCIAVAQARIRTGKYNTTTTKCDEK